MKNRSEVSVVMCTYNGAAYVEEQIASIIKQTYPISELLIFDDGSIDNTAEIIYGIALKNPIINLTVNTRNLGFNKNFEQAINAAHYELIAVSDQDDIWVETKIEKLIAAWNKKAPLIYSASIFFEKEVPKVAIPRHLFRYFEGEDVRKLFMSNTVSGHSMMIRKELLSKAKPFPSNVTYDWWLAVVAACNGGVQYVNEVFVYQRQHTGNATLHAEKYTRQQLKEMYRQEVERNCTAFATIKGMPVHYRRFALRFAHLLHQRIGHRFSFPLFIFLVKKRNILFNYVGQSFLLYYHIKNSYRQAKP